MAQAGIVDLLGEAFGSVSKGHLPPTPLLKALVNKGLGYGIIAGACVTKLPQIFNIVSAGSAEGLSPLSYELETYTLIIHTAYGALNGMAFTSYGEALVLALQNLIILALIYRFSKAGLSRIGSTFSLYGAIVVGIKAGNLDLPFINMLYNANNLVVMASRLPQIWTNVRHKSTGQLSLITCTINVVGSAVRIYTSSQEKAGGALMRAYGLSLSLNLILVTQVLMYYKRTQRLLAASKAKQAQGSKAAETKKTK